ncbi:MAG TPA: methyltransferase, partial [Nitrospiraceae bacterium]|nr:methyltransferase [Nitrospiraceae bacterium]
MVYDEQRTPKTDYPARLAAYLSDRFAIPRGSKLLDVGCGRGDFLEAFQALGMDCSGIDRCESGIERLSHLKVDKADIMTEVMPFPDGTFDVVYHKSVMEHFNSPDRLMQETLRVLKPGGRVIILVPDWV